MPYVLSNALNTNGEPFNPLVQTPVDITNNAVKVHIIKLTMCS